jgi:hypothetical protein
MTIDLVTGNRTVLGTSDSTTVGSMAAVDAANHSIYLGLSERSRVLRFNTTSQEFSGFADSSVGAGPLAAGINGLGIDSRSGQHSLIVSAQLSEFGGDAGAIRLDLDTGTRTLLTGSGRGIGPIIGIAQSAQIDTRPGASENQLLIYDEAPATTRFYGVDLATGNRTVLSSPGLGFYSSGHMVLDAARGRMIAARRANVSDPYTLADVDVLTGVTTDISGPSRGTGAELAALSGDIVDIAIDDVPGGARRYLLAAADSTMTFVDPGTGNRTRLTLSGFTPRITGMDLDVAARRAYVIGDHELAAIDIQSGVGEEISSQTVGSGPAIRGFDNRVHVDAANRVAYVSSDDQMILAVDLLTGQRAIVSR